MKKTHEKLPILTPQLILLNSPISQWSDYLNNDTVTGAILNRIVHSSHRIELEGESMRKLKSNINKSE